MHGVFVVSFKTMMKHEAFRLIMECDPVQLFAVELSWIRR